VPERESSGPAGAEGKLGLPMVPICVGLTDGFLKNAAFAHFDWGTSTTATSCVRLERGVGRRLREGVAGEKGWPVARGSRPKPTP
jgi:hypothetical protein